MAQSRGFSLGSALWGAVVLAVLLLAAGAIVVLGGFYPIAASAPDSGAVRSILNETMEHGVRRAARGLHSPRLTAADIREGAGHFKGMCQECHGGPGVEPEEFAGAMNPRPPDLARAQGDWSREEVFWIAKHGIRMSGMPAFGKIHEDSDLWNIAAFVKALPGFSAAEYAAIPNAHEGEQGEAAEKMGDKHEHNR
jgi:mono/diheme cytochrome c family protein